MVVEETEPPFYNPLRKESYVTGNHQDQAHTDDVHVYT